MAARTWISYLGVVGASLVAAACQTPAQVHEEREVRQQPIAVTKEKSGPTIAEIVQRKGTEFSGRTVTVDGVVSGMMNPTALTLRGPGPDLLVLIPGQVALAPGRSSTQPWKLQDAIRVTGTVHTFAVAQLAPGLYELVPPSNRSSWANRPVLIARDVVYLDLPYTTVGVSPSGVQVAKAPVEATPPPAEVRPKKAPDMYASVPILETVGEIANERAPKTLVGYGVRLSGVTIDQVVGASTFYLRSGRNRVLCVIGEVNEGQPYRERIELRDGAAMTLRGRITGGGVKGLHVWKPLSDREVREIERVPILVWVSYLRD